MASRDLWRTEPMISRRSLGFALLAVGCLGSLSALAEWPRPGKLGRAERALAQRGFDLGTASLLELVASKKDPEARVYALRVLRSRSQEKIRDPLLEIFLTESNPIAHREMAITLALLGEQSAFEFLYTSMREATDEAERIYIALELARLGDVESYPFLTAALASPDSIARADALSGLVDLALGGVVVEPPLDIAALLLQALEDPEPRNRRSALSHISKVVDRGLSADHFLPTVERMVAEDPAPEVKERAELIRSLLVNSKDSRLREVHELLRKRYEEKLREASEDPPPPRAGGRL